MGEYAKEFFFARVSSMHELKCDQMDSQTNVRHFAAESQLLLFCQYEFNEGLGGRGGSAQSEAEPQLASGVLAA